MDKSQPNLAKLSEPFAPEQVHWRVGSTTKDKASAMALAYVDARDIYNRLDLVCGPQNWQCRYPIIAEGKTVCEIGIKFDGEWVWKANAAGDSDIEGAKGAASDAVKRAGVLWGIGRYLYDLKSPWVKIEPFGRSYKICESELPKLHRLLTAKGTVRQNPQPEWTCQTPRATLKKHAWALHNDVLACGDFDSLVALEHQSKQLLQDLKTHMPDAYSGSNDYDGIATIIKKRKAEFSSVVTG